MVVILIKEYVFNGPPDCKIRLWSTNILLLSCEKFEPRSHFISRLSMIVCVNVVLNVDSDWRFDNLCSIHLLSDSEDEYYYRLSKHQWSSTTTVLFWTTFTWDGDKGTGTSGRVCGDLGLGDARRGTWGHQVWDTGTCGTGTGDVKYRDAGDAECEWLSQKSEVNAISVTFLMNMFWWRQPTLPSFKGSSMPVYDAKTRRRPPS